MSLTKVFWDTATLGDVLPLLRNDHEWASTFVRRHAAERVFEGDAWLWCCITAQRAEDTCAAALFDSFFDRIRVGALLRIANSALVLPQLGIRVNATRSGSVEKIDQGTLLVRGGERAPPLPVQVGRVPEQFSTDVVGLRSCPSICLAFDEGVVETVVGRRIEVDASSRGESIDRARAALDLLEGLKGDSLAHHVRRYVRYVVPISGGPRSRASFSYRDAPGIVFLSTDTTPEWTAEAMVHEAAHIELAARLGRHPAFSETRDTLFYSPWKSEPRPAEAVLHGAFSFWRVGQFLHACIQSGIGSFETRRRSIQTLHRVTLALVQLKRAQRTPEGEDLIREIEDGMTALRRGLGGSGALPMSVRAHAQLWMERHPELMVNMEEPESAP
jgi:HEXXH motif-containing protein